MKVVWTDDALLDIERHMGYLAHFNPAAAASVAQHLLDVGNSLKLFPHRGRAGSEPGVRELVAVHPYVVVYEIGDDAVVILRIAQHRQHNHTSRNASSSGLDQGAFSHAFVLEANTGRSRSDIQVWLARDADRQRLEADTERL